MTGPDASAAVDLRPRAAAAEAAYQALVLANREQQSVLASGARSQADAWKERAPRFAAGRMVAPDLDQMLQLARPSDTWLDIGAGGGRYAVPLSQHVASVIALEPSPSMREQLAGAIAAGGVRNIEIVPEAWPDGQSAVPQVDACLIANVLYGADAVGTFLDAAEARARRLCVVVCADQAPNTPLPEIWQALHGFAFSQLPALRELLAVLLARRRQVSVACSPLPPPEDRPVGEVVDDLAWMYGVRNSDEGRRRLAELFLAHFPAGGDTVRVPMVRQYSAVVSWPVPSTLG